MLLVIDNCSAHHVQTSLTAVTLLFLPPNTTSKVQLRDLGIIRAFRATYSPRVVERSVIAVGRPEANLPLRGSLYSVVEIMKAAWSEVTAACARNQRNCFRKAGFVDTQAEAEPDASDGQYRRRFVAASHRLRHGGHDLGWDNFVRADEDVDTVEPRTDEGIVNEVRRNR